MKIKVFALVALLSFGLFVFQSCQRSQKEIVIGLLMDDFATERWAKDTTFFINKVNELGGKVICRIANQDPLKQLEQAKELIDKKVDILVIVPADLEKAGQIVEVAGAAHIQVISYDRLILNSNLDYYVSFDNVKVGELQAEYILNRLGKGNVALIGGPLTDYNSYFLRLGQIGILQPFIEKGDIKIIYDKYASSWSDTSGYRLALSCLKAYPNKVDAFIASNDMLAKGVIEALEEKSLAGKVLVTGQDGDSLACENIIMGKQSMTVYKPIEALAFAAAEAAMAIAGNLNIKNANTTINNGYKLVPSILLAPMVVNKGNIGMQINTVKYMKEQFK
ncbi:MAG TPA: substrate-binding domain-containing protein [Bacteroidales bacterium]|nr:substrate-binding domain-containing protein [Bacteroidales bacterium]